MLSNLIGNDTIRIAGFIFSYIIVIIYTFVNSRSEQKVRKISFLGLFLGASLNIVALLSNGGRMPVFDKIDNYSVWMPMSELTHYNWLGDRFGAFSIGDLLLLPSLLIIILLTLIDLRKGRTIRNEILPKV